MSKSYIAPGMGSAEPDHAWMALHTELLWDESDMRKAKQSPRTPERAREIFQLRKDIQRTKERLRGMTALNGC